MSRSIVELLNAFLDGELPASEAAQVERRLGDETELRQLHDEMLAVRSGLKVLPQFRLGPDFAAKVMRAAKQAMREQQVAISPVTRSLPHTQDIVPKPAVAPWGQVFGWLIAVAAAVLVLVFYVPQRTTFQTGQPEVIAQSISIPKPITEPSVIGGGGLEFEAGRVGGLRNEAGRNGTSERLVEEQHLEQNLQTPLAADPAKTPTIAEKGDVKHGADEAVANRADASSFSPGPTDGKSTWRESVAGAAAVKGIADANSDVADPNGLLVVNIDVTVEAVKLGVLDRFITEHDRANSLVTSDSTKALHDQPPAPLVPAARSRIDEAAKFAKEESPDLKKADANSQAKLEAKAGDKAGEKFNENIDGIAGGELAEQSPAKDKKMAEHNLAIRDGRTPSTFKVVRYAAEADVRVFEVVAERSQFNEMMATLQSQSPDFLTMNRKIQPESLSTFGTRGTAVEDETKGAKKLDSAVKNLATDDKPKLDDTRRKAMANSPLPAPPKSPPPAPGQSVAANAPSAAHASGGPGGFSGGGAAPAPAYQAQVDKPTVEKVVPVALPATQSVIKPAEASPTQVRALLVFRIVPTPAAASPAGPPAQPDASPPPAGKSR